MGTGYTRQSSADIVAGEEITAGPLNSEFNQLEDAFDSVVGHAHDGTVGEAPQISLTTSISGVLPVANGGFAGIHKVNGTTAPAVTDDTGDGYVVGSHWLDTTNDRAYMAVDVTLGAAVWVYVGNATGWQPLDADLTALAALASNGLVARTASNTYALRTITAPAAGITVSNGDGVSGNPTLALADDLAALEALSGTNTIYYRSAASTWTAVTVGGNLTFSGGTLDAVATALDDDLTAIAALGSTGFAVRTASNTWAQRTIAGTSKQLTVTNGDGVSGDPTISLPADVLIPTVLTIPNSGLHILDTNASHDLIITPGSDLSVDRILTLVTGDAARTITLSGNPTLADWFDQAVKTTSSPTFANPTFTTIELGAAATDTTLARSSAGDMTIEGNLVYRAGGTDVPVTDGGTGASTAAAALINLGLTATAAELNVLDGITSTVTELNYVNGVTSAIQTQFTAKANLASPTFTGTPAAPTAADGTDTTQIATTAFVMANGGMAEYKTAQPTTDVAEVVFTGLNGCRVVDMSWAFHGGSGGTYTIQARVSGGTWRTISPSIADGGVGAGLRSGQVRVMGFNVSQDSKNVTGLASWSGTTIDASDAGNISTVNTGAPFAAMPSWNEVWDEIKVVASIEGSSADARGWFTCIGFA